MCLVWLFLGRHNNRPKNQFHQSLMGEPMNSWNSSQAHGRLKGKTAVSTLAWVTQKLHAWIPLCNLQTAPLKSLFSLIVLYYLPNHRKKPCECCKFLELPELHKFPVSFPSLLPRLFSIREFNQRKQLHNVVRKGWVGRLQIQWICMLAPSYFDN